MAKDLIIGLDIGTSSIKLVVLDKRTRTIQLELVRSTQSARVCLQENNQFDEQNVDILIEILSDVFKEIPKELYHQLKGIQLCGQMHGIVLWNSATSKHSNLITWQDGRCNEEFLKKLPIRSISDLNSGFGCASLFWFVHNDPTYLKQFNMAGTIHDYINFLFCGSNIMSVQNALSWGCFDYQKAQWQADLFEEKIQFPCNLLPDVKESSYLMSKSVHVFDLIQTDASIYNALGDLQCSVYSCLQDQSDCVINISTSSQVCIAISTKKYEEIKNKLPKSVTMFPYFHDQLLLVAASLNGGNVLEKFVDMIIDWNIEIGLLESRADNEFKSRLWAKLIHLGEQKLNDMNSISKLKCVPKLFAERHDKQTFASFENININNVNLGHVFASICEGLVRNLKEMITLELLIGELGCKRVIVTGNAIIRNPILKHYLQNEFDPIEIIYKASSDAAIGAANFLIDILNK